MEKSTAIAGDHPKTTHMILLKLLQSTIAILMVNKAYTYQVTHINNDDKA
ncbi:MAG TPA: hypothetical protein VK111_13500 [Virgibacillus sp.]|nr:hypothetical protein [Virgibacillus sp.]